MLSFIQLALVAPALISVALGSSCMAPVPQRNDVNATACTSTPGSGKSVDLKSAADFTVLTQTGCAVVPTIELHGNMGIAPSPMSYITGFSTKDSSDGSFATSAQVINGVIYAADSNKGSPSPLAVQDALAAFYILGNQTGANYRELQSGSLNGLSLYNGLYTWSTAVTLAAGQTLNLNGGKDDVFVFLSAGTMSFGGYSAVVLNGEVNPENVYFVGQTRLEVGANSTLTGTFMTGTNQVFGVGTEIVGRSYANTETAFAHTTSIKTGGCAKSGSC